MREWRSCYIFLDKEHKYISVRNYKIHTHFVISTAWEISQCSVFEIFSGMPSTTRLVASLCRDDKGAVGCAMVVGFYSPPSASRPDGTPLGS